MSSKTTIQNKNPHDTPHQRGETEEQMEAQGSQDPLPHNSLQGKRTEQNQPLDAGTHSEKDTKIGQNMGTGRPPLMKK